LGFEHVYADYIIEPSGRYLATTNLTKNGDGDHAARMARFAMDAVAASKV
jgi:hypothetical protein